MRLAQYPFSLRTGRAWHNKKDVQQSQRKIIPRPTALGLANLWAFRTTHGGADPYVFLMQLLGELSLNSAWWQEWRKINSMARGDAWSIVCNACRASLGVSSTVWHMLLRFRPLHSQFPLEGETGSCSAQAEGRNESMPGSMLQVSHCHPPALPLMEEFGQEPKMQRSLDLAVSLMSDRALWSCWSQHAWAANRQTGLMNHLGTGRLGKWSVLFLSETLLTSPCQNPVPGRDAWPSAKWLQASKLASRQQNLAVMQRSANAAVITLIAMLTQ